MDQALQSLIEQVRAAHARQAPLHIGGGGTKQGIGSPPRGELLDTRTYHGIVSYEPTELVVTVRAGTPLAELEAQLAQQRQYLPFEPPRFASGGTVGGMVAAGLAGPARASAGGVRDYVLGVRMINGLGQDLHFGGQVMKNVAGYDVSRLMAGSWGQLGVITEVSLKVLPVAPAEATLRFDCSQSDALRRLQAWCGQPLPLNASCWVHDAGADTLYLRLRGASAAVEFACRTLGGERMGASAAADWDACRDQRLPWFAAGTPATGLDLWRLSVPAAVPALDLPADLMPPLIEWHGALRWVRAPAGHASALRQAAHAVGGHAQLFRASAAAAAPAAAPEGGLPPALRNLHERVRQSFDPAGIFNPGALAGMD
jgi:glycolate oxidase FAD binding subunit